ncbi:cupin domain-containing protein [Saccharibacillus sp. CPCC 101409]|uniref:cupin domain-containing protein n=1 Tax=Saccharibacillus sp. CPCC 101409 TaxID=3058041 RepID=UPI0026734436|nr:cupin domain-containing protein [Saccharibacillus sp. CPCC 101409]MDO3412431.1 cupin domain-containing protein [Saccharibacillus sp. CPCC 101409]
MEKKALSAFQEYQDDKFTKKIVFKENGHVAFVLNFGPGRQLPTHNHPGATVYLTVLEGRGVMIADGVETEVSQGDLVQVAGHEAFAYRSADDSRSSLSVVLINTPSEEFAKEV